MAFAETLGERLLALLGLLLEGALGQGGVPSAAEVAQLITAIRGGQDIYRPLDLSARIRNVGMDVSAPHVHATRACMGPMPCALFACMADGKTVVCVQLMQVASLPCPLPSPPPSPHLTPHLFIDDHPQTEAAQALMAALETQEIASQATLAFTDTPNARFSVNGGGTEEHVSRTINLHDGFTLISDALAFIMGLRKPEGNCFGGPGEVVW